MSTKDIELGAIESDRNNDITVLIHFYIC